MPKMPNVIVHLTPCLGNRKQRKMDTLGFESRAFRMRSGCDTTTPCARVTRFCESSHQTGAMFMPRILRDYGFGRAIAGVVRWATPAPRLRKWQPRADQFGPRGSRESDHRGELVRGRRQLTPALPPATVGILSQFFRPCFLKTCRLLWFWKWAKTVSIGLCNPVLTVTQVLFLHSDLLARLLLSPANDIRLLVLAVSLRNPFVAYFCYRFEC